MRATRIHTKSPSRAAAAFIATAALALSVAGCGDLSRDELSRGVDSLAALAAQGRLIANGVARDSTKSTYARVMSKTLGGQADHEAEKLADAEPESGTGEERDLGVAVAREISDLFSALEVYPGDESVGERVEAKMLDAQEQAEAIVVRLEETE